jgi:DNA polymerase-3 subunit alpha
MSSEDFVHLHVHSEYSLLDSTIQVNDLIKKACDLGQKSIALTDNGNMFGAIEFYVKAKKAGIKPILGAVIYLTLDSRHSREDIKSRPNLKFQDEMEAKHGIYQLVLLCKDNLGYENLCKIISTAYLDGIHYRPRADFEILEKHSKGLIALSAGLKGVGGSNFFAGEDEKGKAALLKLKDIFKEDFFIEIQNHYIKEEEVFSKLIDFAREQEVPLVASNDVHYLNKEDALAQDVLMCVGSKKTFYDSDRMKYETNEFFLKSTKEMNELFSDYPEALSNTLKISEKCNVDLVWHDEKGNQIYHLPDFKIDTGETQEEYFKRLTLEGLEERFSGPHFVKIIKEENWEAEIKPGYISRAIEELEMICSMGFAGYFLIVAEFIQWSKKRDIPVGPGRGSGAGSIVAYALQITNINPIPYNLLFERFINPERISMPDFDIDFCQLRRGEVIDHVTEMYGVERVGQIVTFGKLQAKAAIRDVSRVFGLPYTEADMLAKLVPDELGITLDEALETEPKFGELQDSDPKIKQIIEVSRGVEKLNRHASIHAAGVIITSEPLVKYCPIFVGAKGERVIQFDKNWSEEIGLVKFDFLGLKTLTVISLASEHIKKGKDKDFNIENIDLEDEEVFDYISAGETIGVFQLESSGMIDLCKRIKPDSIEDITAINALYRPGPMESGMVDDFVDIKNGKKQIKYPFPELAPVLQDTLGVIVYQEQVMNIARLVAGYSLGQADMLRRAMGKKKEEEMNRHREIFRKGAVEKGFDEKKAVDLFEQMALFAKYGFNKSHAVAYAFIAYQTAFLKYYHPVCFFAGLLSTELNNTDKITAYIYDAKKQGCEILPPDINESIYLFNVVEGSLRFALGAIKNVGGPAVAEIVREREENGPFKSFLNFCERVDLRLVNRRSLESLIKVGCFDPYEEFNRKTLLENLDLFISHGQKKAQDRKLGQGNLFDLAQESSEVTELPDLKKLLGIRVVSEFDSKEKLDFERNLVGIYLSGHPLDGLEDLIEQVSSMPVEEVQNIVEEKKKTTNWKDSRGKEITLVGLMMPGRKLLTKKGDKMCIATLEDKSGKIECVVFPKTYAEYEGLFIREDLLVMEGNVNYKENPKKFFPSKIRKLSDVSEERVSAVYVTTGIENMASDRLKGLKESILAHPGTKPLILFFQGEEGKARMSLGKDYLVSPSPQLSMKINDVFKTNSVKLIIGSTGE